jgi:hypothetical protein
LDEWYEYPGYCSDNDIIGQADHCLLFVARFSLLVARYRKVTALHSPTLSLVLT